MSGATLADERSFLAGPTLYLRGLHASDAARITAWRPSPFPIPADLAEERLRQDVAGDAANEFYRLVACRLSDDEPVGSISYWFWERTGVWLTMYVDPLIRDHDGAIKAELLRIVHPWLLVEQDRMTLWFINREGEPAVEQAVADLGMRRAFEIRESIVEAGRRRDQVYFEGLNPGWVAKLGLPEPYPEGEPVVKPASPAAPPSAARLEHHPDNAFVIGKRLYLRPLEERDAEEIAKWSLRETEHLHDEGRFVYSPLHYWHAHRSDAEIDPPTEIRFAIVTLDDETVIGYNRLVEIDWIHRTGETKSEIVREDFRGAGFGTEAKHLLLEYAFERIGLHMIRSKIWEYNARSGAALIKQGYRVAGRLCWTGFKQAELAHDIYFDLLADEWRAHRRTQQ